jgi:hypothetical protein
MHLTDGIHQRGEVQTTVRHGGGTGLLADSGLGLLLRGHGSVLLAFRIATKVVFDVVGWDEIQLLLREPVVPREHRVDFVNGQRILNLRRRLEPGNFEEGKRKASRVEVITI